MSLVRIIDLNALSVSASLSPCFLEALSYSKNETCDSTLYLNNVQIDIVSAEWRTNKTADV